jgi:hypothetical protein
LKLTAVVAALAIALISFMRPSTAKSQPALVANAASGADLANEERVIGKYFDDLVAYDKQSAELGKRARLVSADLEPLQSKSDDLKGRLSGIQNTVREIVSKLKAANEWNDLDTSIAAKITEGSSNAFLKETSFKQLLEASSNSLTSHANEISTPLDDLRKRLTSRYDNGADVQIVRAGYEAPIPFTAGGLRCTIGTIRIKLIIKLGGVPTRETADKVFQACHPGQSSPS